MAIALVTHSMNAASGGGVVVDLDVTVVGQVVLFLILLVVLKPLLFEPMLKLFEERENRIEGAKLQARKMDEASAGALSKYEAEMHKARTAGNARAGQAPSPGREGRERDPRRGPQIDDREPRRRPQAPRHRGQRCPQGPRGQSRSWS